MTSVASTFSTASSLLYQPLTPTSKMIKSLSTSLLLSTIITSVLTLPSPFDSYPLPPKVNPTNNVSSANETTYNASRCIPDAFGSNKTYLPPVGLRITAVVGGKADISPTSNSSDPNAKVSRFECWQLNDTFAPSMQSGTTGESNVQMSLGGLKNATYTYFAKESVNGLHNAPYPQFVMLLSGQARVSLPNDTAVEEFSVGVMNIATDIPSESDHGHLTTWGANTAVVQAVFDNSTGPIHTVIHQGPCREENFYFTNGTTDPYFVQ